MRFLRVCISIPNRHPQPGDDVDLCGIAELGEELFAVFPGETEGAYVGEAYAAVVSRMAANCIRADSATRHRSLLSNWKSFGDIGIKDDDIRSFPYEADNIFHEPPSNSRSVFGVEIVAGD